MNRADLDALLSEALSLATDAEAEAILTERRAALTRFANSRIHQNVAERDATLRLRLVRDGRTGVASTNRLDREGLREVVARASATLALATPNPDGAALATANPSNADVSLGFVAATAHADPDLRAAGARAVISAGDSAHLESSGAFSTETATLAVANTRGMRNVHSVTQAKLLTVMMGANGASGYAQATAPDIRAIDPSAVGEEAADKAARSADAVVLEPGEYPVVLEEYAVATLLEYLSWVGFSALAVEEGRSFMELGQQIMGSNVSIWDDGLDPLGLPTAIDYEGVPKQRVDLITNGVAHAVVHDTATAARAGVASTGHGLPAPNSVGPMAWNLFMSPGSSAKEVMLSGIDRGVWVTRFHYVNIVHAKRGILTGMTKDGTFLIEDGRITRPIRNLRFSQSIPDAFSAIEAIGSETRLVAAEYSGINVRVPALRLAKFAFTGATGAEAPG
ncbi:MAG TPA: TldD/PmbA family protein [Methylomirabilota bacterium]|nr:TldD/PmbA family protein [Methylomirabilota bacterium]